MIKKMISVKSFTSGNGFIFLTKDPKKENLWNASRINWNQSKLFEIFCSIHNKKFIIFFLFTLHHIDFLI